MCDPEAFGICQNCGDNTCTHDPCSCDCPGAGHDANLCENCDEENGGACIGGCYTCETDLYEWHEYEVRGDKLFCGSRFCVRDDTHPDSDDEEDSDNEEDD